MLTYKEIHEKAIKNRDDALGRARMFLIDNGYWDGDPWHYQQAQSIIVWSQPYVIEAQNALFTIGDCGYDGNQQLLIIKTSTPGDVLVYQGLMPPAIPLSPLATIGEDYINLTANDFKDKYGITQSQYNLGELPNMPAIPGLAPAVIH
jgi:hypothetical protein